MLNYPFTQIFNRHERIFGIPILYLYFMSGWAVSILVIYLFAKATDLPDDEHHEGERR